MTLPHSFIFAHAEVFSPLYQMRFKLTVENSGLLAISIVNKTFQELEQLLKLHFQYFKCLLAKVVQLVQHFSLILAAPYLLFQHFQPVVWRQPFKTFLLTATCLPAIFVGFLSASLSQRWKVRDDELILVHRGRQRTHL